MRKRILSLALALCLLLALMPQTSLTALAYEPLDNDSFGSATTISTGTPYTSQLKAYNDIDYFKFTIPSDGYVSLTLTHELLDYSGSVYDIVFYTSDGSELWSDYSCGNETSLVSPNIGLPAGQYYIKISARNSSIYNKSYGITANFTAASDWETELNDSYASADPMSLNCAIHGALMGTYDTDYYAFQLKSADTLSITFAHEALGSDNSLRYTVKLIDENGKELQSFDSKGSSAETKGSSLSLSAGKYYVKVLPYWSLVTTIDYSLTVNSQTAQHTHSFGPWKTVVSPTTTSTGLEERICSCGYKQTRTLDKLPVTGQCPFVDVPRDAYYYNSVLWAVKKGITNGRTPTTFEPDAKCKRSEIVTFLYRAMGSPSYSLNRTPFTDIEPGAFYQDALLWSYENNIVNGVKPTEFWPNEYCLRSQVVTILWRVAGSPKPSSTRCSFSDVPSDMYCYDAILWAVENGITNGMPGGIFGVDQPCTRSQIVTFLQRFVG